MILHIGFLSQRSRITVHLAREVQIVLLLAEKVTIPVQYLDFADVFVEKSANILPKQIGANEQAIKLERDKQPSYGPIYNLELVEFKTFKTNIETNLANGFIKALKSPASALILCVFKPNSNLYLCVNYQGLNNLTIKNWYPLSLIGESLDQLS